LLTTNAGQIDPYPRAPNILHRLWLFLSWRRYGLLFLGAARLFALLRPSDG
jgi:hypothetical protein